MQERLRKQLEFIVEVDKAKEIFRQTLVSNGKRYENDAEHSWHLALMAPLLKEYVKDDVNIERVMNMVIIHDLVEIDAGDTFCYDVEGYKDKAEREQKAADRIFNLLPEDQAEIIFGLWNEFEEMSTPESKYANVLDRLQPILLNIATDGRKWLDNGTSRDMVLKRMAVIEEESKELWTLVNDLVNFAVEKGYLKK